MENDKKGESHLSSLSEYKPRENVQKGCLNGRYGAIPFFCELNIGPMRSLNSLMRERQEVFRDSRLIVLASEDKDPERIYFKALAKEYVNLRVHVHIVYLW